MKNCAKEQLLLAAQSCKQRKMKSTDQNEKVDLLYFCYLHI